VRAPIFPERRIGADLSQCAAAFWRSLKSGVAAALNALFLPGMDVMCLEGASASVTPRASSGYHESPAGNRNLLEVSQHDQHNRKKA
jgi:hypothetical protein